MCHRVINVTRHVTLEVKKPIIRCVCNNVPSYYADHSVGFLFSISLSIPLIILHCFLFRLLGSQYSQDIMGQLKPMQTVVVEMGTRKKQRPTHQVRADSR